MFYNFKDQILNCTEPGTEYRCRRYFFQKVSNIAPFSSVAGGGSRGGYTPPPPPPPPPHRPDNENSE